jgi:hypothetical protein
MPRMIRLGMHLFNIYSGLDGTVLKALPLPKTIRVSRRKIRALFNQGIDVQVGNKVGETYSG